MVTSVISSARWLNPAQFIENATNKVVYRTNQRKVESDLIEKLICLTWTPGSYTPDEKETLVNQLTPAAEAISPKDRFDGFHSIEIACLAKIAKEKINGENRLSFHELIANMKAAEPKAGEKEVNIFEGAGYSDLSAVDKIFNSKLVRQLAQQIPGSFGNLLQLRCFEATVSLVAIALRNLITIMSGVTPPNSSGNREEQRREVKIFIKNRLPTLNPNEQSLAQSLLPKEQTDLDSLLDTLFKPDPKNTQDNNIVDLALSLTLEKLREDLEKIDPPPASSEDIDTNKNALLV